MEKSDIDDLYNEYKNKFEGEEIVLGEGNLDAKP